MEYKHIDDCWNAIRDAKTTEELEALFDNFPRWSGYWEWYLEDDEVVVENTYYDKNADSWETDAETLDIEIGDDEYDD
ncbi:MAG: hypothetical protein J6W64_07950 [Bacilli bacterium]|nr:hypothetical protein [Bacilli bacterium]